MVFEYNRRLGWFHKENKMTKRPMTKLIHVGKYVAEVSIELILHG